MRILFIVIDGLADRPIKQLENKTPLEAAKTPHLDWLAQNGRCGLIEPFLLSGQKYPESDTAHLALLGYNPAAYYLGRGPYEAAGVGLRLKKGDVVLRANFATVGKTLKIIDRRAGRITQTQPLASSLNGLTLEGVKFLIKKSTDHRAVLVLRGLTPATRQKLSHRISDNDPEKLGARPKKIIPLEKKPSAQFTADILNKFLATSYQILNSHLLNKKRERLGNLPANYLLVRGAGTLKPTPTFRQKYGLKAACIAGAGLYKGIGKLLGMRLIEVKGATGTLKTNLRGKFSAALRAIKDYDFIFCHIKAADNLAADGDFLAKKAFIERVDRALGPVTKLKNVLLVVTADHATCSSLKRHCQGAVPLLVFGGGHNGLLKFSEKACRKGKLGKLKALELMPKLQTLTQIYAKTKKTI